MAMKNQTAKRRQERDIFDRVLIWFGLSVVLELFLLALNRYYFHYRVSEIEFAYTLDRFVLPVLTWIGLLGAAACVGWAILRRRRDESLLLPLSLVPLSLVIGLASLLSRYYGQPSLYALQVIVPVAAVLALVYYLYQREFFVAAVLSGLCIFGLWLFRRAGVGHELVSYGYFAGLAALSACVALGARLLQGRNGVLELGGRPRRIFQLRANYSIVYATCAIAALSVAAALVGGAMAAYVAIFVVMAWTFVIAVYCTVRLM